MSSVAENDAPAQAKAAANDVPQDVPHIAVANIPAQLKALPHWVCWKWETRDGKRTKPPYNARTGSKASSTDPATWSTFKAALAVFNAGGYAGIGFVLTKEAGIVGIDLDYVLDGAQGVMEWPRGSRLCIQPAEVVALLDTYTEITPSGAGLRCFVFGDLPAGWRKAGDVEIYDSGRFLTVTGHHWPDSPPTIEARPGEVAALHAGMLPPPVPPPTGLNGYAGNGSNGNDARHLTASELWAVMFRAKNGQRIQQLFDGAWQAAGYGSQSEADSALCHDLAFYAQGDAARVDGLFRETGLMREKWDKRHYGSGETYGLHTVSEACRRTVKHYAGPSQGVKMPRRTASQNGAAPESESEAETAPVFTQTDVGNADRLVWRHGIDLLYCYPAASWFTWNGRQWARDESGEIERRAEDTARSILDEARQASGDERRTELAKWATASLSRRRVRDMAECARCKVPMKFSALDADPWLLNLSNGTLDLHSMELREHRRGDLLSKILPLDYDPAARCEVWTDFLMRVMDYNCDLVEFLQRAIGYSLTGDISEQCVWILHGTGSNGKSTFLDALRHLFADYGLQMDAKTITLQKHEPHIANDVARLKGARFVATAETGQDRRLDENKLKQMTGGDSLVGEYKYQEAFEFEPTHKIWLATNHLPTVRDPGNAIWRRLHLVPFGVQFWDADKGQTGDADKRMDKTLPVKLRDELPGILAWAIEGCRLWQEKGLTAPKAVQEATAGYRAEMDVVAQFLLDACCCFPDAECQAKELYARYSNWCDSSGEHKMSQRALSMALQDRGHERKKDRTGAHAWRGIGILAI